jgi:hypothetical protein
MTWVSRFMSVTILPRMAFCVSQPPHWLLNCCTVSLSHTSFHTWCLVFKQTQCVYAFCSVIYFRGSYKTMDHSKTLPGCGNITHIWQSSWTMLYQTAILPVWYGIMFLLIRNCYTAFFFSFLTVNFCTVLQNLIYRWCVKALMVVMLWHILTEKCYVTMDWNLNRSYSLL